jgi:hypothetical protein
VWQARPGDPTGSVAGDKREDAGIKVPRPASFQKKLQYSVKNNERNNCSVVIRSCSLNNENNSQNLLANAATYYYNS